MEENKFNVVKSTNPTLLCPMNLFTLSYCRFQRKPKQGGEIFCQESCECHLFLMDHKSESGKGHPDQSKKRANTAKNQKEVSCQNFPVAFM